MHGLFWISSGGLPHIVAESASDGTSFKKCYIMYEQQIKFIFDYHRMQGDTGLKSLNHISMLASTGPDYCWPADH